MGLLPVPRPSPQGHSSAADLQPRGEVDKLLALQAEKEGKGGVGLGGAAEVQEGQASYHKSMIAHFSE